MDRILNWTLALALLAGTAGAGLNAGGASRVNERAAAVRPAAVDESLALLPASDLIAVVDVARFFNELLPRVKAVAPDDVAKFTEDINKFTSKTGIDPAKVKTAVIGIRMEGNAQTGEVAAILEGLTIDPKRIEAAVKDEKGEFKTMEHKGKPFYLAISKPQDKEKEKEKDKDKAQSADGKPAPERDEVAFAQLDKQGVVVGDVSSVKNVLDAQAGAGNSKANAALGEALKEAERLGRGSGLLRFVANLPESARQGLSSQGDLFKQLAAVKLIFGSLGVTGDLGVALDAKLRTGSNSEATELETSLKNLVQLGKMFLGGNQDPKMQAFNKLLDEENLKFGVQTSDVSLSITLPKSVLDQFSKSAPPAEGKASSPKKP